MAVITPEPLIVTVDPSTFTPPNTDVVAVGKVYTLPPVDEITPLPLIVIVLPSILTPPNTVVLAVGNEYPPVLLIIPPLIVIVDPSTRTPPNTVVLAVGNVYAVPGVNPNAVVT